MVLLLALVAHPLLLLETQVAEHQAVEVFLLVELEYLAEVVDFLIALLLLVLVVLDKLVVEAAEITILDRRALVE
jgi:hypothetical protein